MILLGNKVGIIPFTDSENWQQKSKFVAMVNRCIVGR